MLTRRQFNKLFNSWDLISISIGITIGIGIFRVPSEIAQYLQNPHIILFAWLVGGILSYVGALCYSELSSSIPETGGDYIYLKKCYGLFISFLFAWGDLLVIRAGSIAALSFIFSEYLQSLLNLDSKWIKPAAMLIILILCLINILSVNWGKYMQNSFSILKVLILLIIFSSGILCGIFLNKGRNLYLEPLFITNNLDFVRNFGLALIPILWTYGGWHETVILAGETKNPKKAVPRSLIIGIFLITSVYIGMNFLYLYLVPFELIKSGNLIATELMKIIYGSVGKTILEVLIIVSSVGVINALIITSGYLTSAIATDFIKFRYLLHEHKKFQTKYRAIIFVSVIAILYIIFGDFKKLLFFTGSAYWLFFTLVVSSIFIFRKKFKDPDIFRVPCYPILPMLFVLVCLFLFANTFLSFPKESFIGLLIILSGTPIYFVIKNK